MSELSYLNEVYKSWSADREIQPNFIFSTNLESVSPSFADFPTSISPKLVDAFELSGVNKLYSHQKQAWDHSQKTENLVITSGTASGKSLCYYLPILDKTLKDPNVRSLLLFPTKALAQDQLNKLSDLLKLLPDHQIKVAAYDGDTPSNQRKSIRESANIIVSNPDMLHLGILPHHTRWFEFFSNLHYVVLDEIHTYRGVFGSHVANVIRRLERVTSNYGSDPQFMMTSATIGNAQDLAEKLIGQNVTLLAEDGAGRGNKRFFIYNPPFSNADLGIRKSALFETIRISEPLIKNDLQSIIFARTRRTVELLLASLHQYFPASKEKMKGYRSGYLPKDRREIERGLREKKVTTVVATNALELGVDIGALDVSILVGYPGTIASTIQQIGRSGRKSQDSLAVLVATADPIDQFLARNPDYLLGLHPENALIDPDHLLILLNHLQCSAFEIPFTKNDHFGSLSPKFLGEFLTFLSDQGILHESKGKYYWMQSSYPSSEFNLRSTSAARIDLIRTLNDTTELFGIVDRTSAFWMVHPGAIYLHEGQTYLVDDLNLDDNSAIMHPVTEDYFTEPQEALDIKITSKNQEYHNSSYSLGYGELLVTSQVVGYKKIKNFTHEVLGLGQVDLPEFTFDTVGTWLVLADSCADYLRDSGLWRNDPNNYGPTWPETRKLIIDRDGRKCQNCGRVESGISHHVHHVVPFRMFTDLSRANSLENLTTLCPNCHQKAEMLTYVRSGLAGLAYILRHILPLHLMCDIADIEVHHDPQSTILDQKPVIIIFDAIAGGIGLSSLAFEKIASLLPYLYNFIEQCPCQDGCPSCIGPGGEAGSGGKKETLAILGCISRG
jgi:DEAD/DEAH box helicase domain-containing protein